MTASPGRLYSTIIFDYDYTLVDASDCLFSALESGLHVIGVRSPDRTQLKKLIGIPLRAQFHQLAPGRDQQFTEFEKVYATTRRAKELTGTRILPEVARALTALAANGTKMAIVSTGASGRIQRTMKHFGLESYFAKAIIGGEEDKATGIVAAMRLLAAGPFETVYVGDRPEDRAAASRADVAFIGVLTGAFARAELGDAVLDSVADLPSYLGVSV